MTINQTSAGSYLLSITQGGQPLGCSAENASCETPVPLLLLPGPPDLSRSYFVAPASLQLVAGEAVALAVFLQDGFGNTCSGDGLQLQFMRPNAAPILASILQVRLPLCQRL